MNRLASPIRLASISILATTAACASQVDGDHQGDALAELSGQVSNDRTTPVGDAAEVVVVWHNSAGSPDVIAAEAVEVEFGHADLGAQVQLGTSTSSTSSTSSISSGLARSVGRGTKSSKVALPPHVV